MSRGSVRIASNVPLDGGPPPPPPPPRPQVSSATDAVENRDIEKLIPLINRITDAVSLTTIKSEIALPQIAVVGGQSSGKSSVLENIVGKSFLPRGSGIVTRRPLVLQLINSKDSTEYGEFLHKPNEKFYDFEQIRAEIEADTARICGSNKGLSNKEIRLKVCSPNVLNLTLIDLPGVTRVPVGDQPADIGDQIRTMVLNYINKETCIILAVTAANTDLANSDAIELSKKVDPTGARTLGVLTKLDLMDRGTDARDIFTGESTDLPQLKLGYIGVVNRSQADINERKTIATARSAENDFFISKSCYSDIAHLLGTAYLVRACSKLLASHIKATLPSLERNLETTLEKKEKELEEIGDQSNEGKRDKLMNTLLIWCERFKALISGDKLAMSDRGHRVDELSGGARIERIFRDIFEPDVKCLQVLDDLTLAEVQTKILNCQGLGGGLFVPDDAVDELVDRNIKRLRKPATKCGDLVHAELVALVEEASDFPALHSFPDLKTAVETLVRKLLRTNLDDTDSALQTICDMELCRINKTHPDFVGCHGIAALMASIEQRVRKETDAPAPQAQPIASNPLPPPAAVASPEPSSSSSQKNSFFSRKTKSTPSSASQADSSTPFGKKTLTPAEINALRAQMQAEVGPVSTPTNDDAPDQDDGTIDPRDRARIQQLSNGLTIKEKVDVYLILELTSSYFGIVKRTFADLGPKAVTLKLVQATTNDLTRKVLRELNNDSSIETLMNISSTFKQHYENLQTNVAALKKAIAAIKEMKYAV